jgi:hypothetical protein
MMFVAGGIRVYAGALNSFVWSVNMEPVFSYCLESL